MAAGRTGVATVENEWQRSVQLLPWAQFRLGYGSRGPGKGVGKWGKRGEEGGVGIISQGRKEREGGVWRWELRDGVGG